MRVLTEQSERIALDHGELAVGGRSIHLENILGNPSGFTLIETLIAVAIFAVVLLALSNGINAAIGEARVNTLNLRATQILTEKMELLRACPWNEITNSYNFIPASFTVPFSSSTPTNSEEGNFAYQGTVSIVNAPVTEAYSTNLRQVTVSVAWTSGTMTRERSMTTFVSPYGIQAYSY
jgi:prepilin-type N-terminal cleavage/methylation domain-containing protein